MSDQDSIKPRIMVRIQRFTDGIYMHIDDLDEYLAQAIGNLEKNLGVDHPEVAGAVTILTEIRRQVALTRLDVDLSG